MLVGGYRHFARVITSENVEDALAQPGAFEGEHP